MRLNVGCGASPTPGWRNFDNSPATKLASRPIQFFLLKTLGMLDRNQLSFIRYCKGNRIDFANGCKLPIENNSAEVHYCSHTLEHLTREVASKFLKEAFRVLRPGGVIRIAVPNLEYYCKKYLQDGDIDYLMHYLHMIGPPVVTVREKLRFLLIGQRHHQWMYDGPYLVKVVQETGFIDVRAMQPGETMIEDPAPLNLYERTPESLFVEGRKP